MAEDIFIRVGGSADGIVAASEAARGAIKGVGAAVDALNRQPAADTLSKGFTSTADRAQKLEIAFKNAELGNRGFNAALREFGGADVVAKANSISNAVSAIGGATKLTETEQRKVNAAVTEAIAKYDALGKKAPADLRMLADETRRANTEIGKTSGALSTVPGNIGSITSSLKGVAGAMGVAFSVGAVTSWVSNTLAAASTIDDLSKKLGVSAEAVQRWKFAAEQGGGTIETVEQAVFNMNRSLAVGDKSTVTALRDAGLSFSTLRGMAPEAAFNAIAEAVGKIEDPMLQARLATELFGKAGADLLPALIEGFGKTGDAIDVMANATVKRLADAKDAWGRLTSKVTIYSGELIAATLDVTSEATKSWGSFFEFMKRGAVNMLMPGSYVPPPTGNERGLTPAQIARDEAFTAVFKKQQADRIAEAARALAARNAAEAAAEKAAEAAKRAAEASAKALRQAADQISGLSKVEAAQQTARAVAFNANRDFLTMEDAERKKVNTTLYEGIRASERLGRVVPESMRRAYAATYQFKDVLAEMPPLIQGIDFTKVGQSIAPMRTAFADINLLLGPVAAKMETFSGFTATFGKVVTPAQLGQVSVQKVSAEVQSLTKLIDAIPGLLQQALTGGGGFGGFGKALTSMIGADVGKNLFSASGALSGLTKAVSGGASKLFGDTFGAAMGLAMPGIGAALGALAGPLIEKVFSSFRNVQAEKVNDLRDDFLKRFGTAGTGAGSGFGELAKQLNALGPAGDALFNRVLSAKKVDEFEAAMKAANAALANSPEALTKAAGYQTRQELQATADKAREVYDYMRASGKFTAEDIATQFEKSKKAQLAAMDDTQRGAIEANQKRVDAYTKQLADLNAEYDKLFADVSSEAPEEVMGVVETAQRARMDAIVQERQAVEAQLEDANTALQDSMAEVDGSVTTLNTSLRDQKTVWDDWADNAIRRARDVETAVNAISFGRSPGGLKEIPIQLGIAADAARQFTQTTRELFGGLEGTINGATLHPKFQVPHIPLHGVHPAESLDGAHNGHRCMTDDPVGGPRGPVTTHTASFDHLAQIIGSSRSIEPTTGAPHGEAASLGGTREIRASLDTLHAGVATLNATIEQFALAKDAGPPSVTFHPGAIVIERPILKDKESIQELGVEVSKHLRTALTPHGAW